MMAPTIYFFCFDLNTPAGGIKKIYRHVDILNQHGFNAYVLHDKKGFRCTWFDNETRVISTGQLRIKADDYLVIPEECFTDVARLAPHIRKVVFNQGCYNTFARGYSLDINDWATPYMDEKLMGAVVVSDDSRDYLTYAFPHLPVYRVHYSIDPHIFCYHEPKERMISFMTRKCRNDALQVINILKFRNALAGFKIVPIENKTQTEVAEIFRRSLIYLNFCYQEGFSMPPAEAMACGAIAVGYHGNGGREFFKPEFSYPIGQGNVLAYVRAVEEVLALARNNPEKLTAKAKAAAAFIAQEYSPEREEDDVIKTWQTLLGVTALRQL